MVTYFQQLEIPRADPEQNRWDSTTKKHFMAAKLNCIKQISLIFKRCVYIHVHCTTALKHTCRYSTYIYLYINLDNAHKYVPPHLQCTIYVQVQIVHICTYM